MKKKKKNRAYNNEWVDRFTTALVCMHLICSCMIKKKKKKCIPPDDKHVIFPPCCIGWLCSVIFDHTNHASLGLLCKIQQLKLLPGVKTEVRQAVCHEKGSYLDYSVT